MQPSIMTTNTKIPLPFKIIHTKIVPVLKSRFAWATINPEY